MEGQTDGRMNGLMDKVIPIYHPILLAGGIIIIECDTFLPN